MRNCVIDRDGGNNRARVTITLEYGYKDADHVLALGIGDMTKGLKLYNVEVEFESKRINNIITYVHVVFQTYQEYTTKQIKDIARAADLVVRDRLEKFRRFLLYHKAVERLEGQR